MAEYDNTNRGVLFVNDRKEKDTQPDRTGSLNVEGVEYFFDGWLKESKDGKKFLSVSVKRKDKQPESAPAPRAQARPAPAPIRGNGSAARAIHGDDDFDGQDIPF